MSERLIILQPSEFREIIADAVSEGVQRSQRKPTARTVLTLQQLAEEWQVTRQAIRKWTERGDHPLPVHYLGSAPRFYRYEVEQWSRAEADRRKEKTQ